MESKRCPAEISPTSRAVVAGALCAGLLALVALLIRTLYSPDLASIKTQAAELFWALEWVKPKPVEQMLVQSALLLFPFCAGIGWALAPRLLPALSGTRISGLAKAGLPVLLLACVALTSAALARADFLYISGSVLQQHPIVTLLLGLSIVATLPSLRLPERLARARLDLICFILAVAGCALTLGAFSLFNEAEPPHMPHLNPLLYALAEYARGAPLGREVISLYGLYPVLVAPFFGLAGGSFSAAIGVFAALVVVTVALTAWLTRRAILNPYLATCTFLASTYYSHINPKIFIGDGAVLRDPYFQYVPIRKLFPVLVLLTLAFGMEPRRQKACGWAAFALSVVAILWNVDSGLACMAGTLAFAFAPWLVAPSQLWKERWALLRAAPRFLLTAAAIAAAVVTTFSLLFFAHCGEWPEIATSISLPALCSRYGFTFVQLPHGLQFWQIICVLYVVGFFYAMTLCARREELSRGRFLAALCITGLALMMYYFGRSDAYNIYNPSWLFYVVMGVLAQALLAEWRTLPWTGRGFFVLLSFYLAVGAVSILSNARVVYDGVQVGIRAWRDRAIAHQQLTTVYDFIHDQTQPGGQALILTRDQESMLYLGSATRPALRMPSTSELFLRSQVQRVLDFLAANTTVPVFAQPGEDDHSLVIHPVGVAGNQGYNRLVAARLHPYFCRINDLFQVHDVSIPAPIMRAYPHFVAWLKLFWRRRRLSNPAT